MIVLDLGSGPVEAQNVALFQHFWPGASVVRLDGVADVRPDVVGDVRSLPLASASVDAVYASHLLEHFYEREMLDLCREWVRCLRAGGRFMVIVPDAQEVARLILRVGVAGPAYEAVAFGSIRPLDMIYGHQRAQENNPLMEHHYLFDAASLRGLLQSLGLVNVETHVQDFQLMATGVKRGYD